MDLSPAADSDDAGMNGDTTVRPLTGSTAAAHSQNALPKAINEAMKLCRDASLHRDRDYGSGRTSTTMPR
jgi:hypothetical protein